MIYDYQAILFYNNLGEKTKKELTSCYNTGVELLIASDITYIDGMKISDNLANKGFLCSDLSVESRYATGVDKQSFPIEYLVLIYIFGILNVSDGVLSAF